MLPRDLHAEYLCVLLVSRLQSSAATEIRGLQKSEQCEVEEFFGQRSRFLRCSQTQPYRRKSRHGLARVIRGHSRTAWRERRSLARTSHSSAEGIITPDTIILIGLHAQPFWKYCQEFDGFSQKIWSATWTLRLVWFFSQRAMLTLIEKAWRVNKPTTWCKLKTAHSWDNQVDSDRFSKQIQKWHHALTQEGDRWNSNPAYYTKRGW